MTEVQPACTWFPGPRNGERQEGDKIELWRRPTKEELETVWVTLRTEETNETLWERCVPFQDRVTNTVVTPRGNSLCLKGYSSQWEIHYIYLHLYNILVVHSNWAQRSLTKNYYSIIVPATLHVGFRALPSWDLCASDVNRLRHWRMHSRSSYVCPMVFDVSSTDCLRHNHNY